MGRAWEELGRAARRLRWLVHRGELDVVVYGRSSKRWMRALGQSGHVWPLLPQVGRVRVVAPGTPLPPGRGRQVVLPLIERHIRAVAAAGMPALVPDTAALDTFHDKARFARHVAAHGLGHLVPITYEAAGDTRFPAVLKRTDLSGGQGVVVVDSADELHQRLGEEMWKDRPVILQELVEGTLEHSTHLVSIAGETVWTCSYTYVLPTPRSITTSAMVRDLLRYEPSAAVLEDLAKFTRSVKFTGPCNISYKIRPDGRIAVMEVNGRLGASLMLPEHAADLAQCLKTIFAHAGWTRPGQ